MESNKNPKLSELIKYTIEDDYTLTDEDAQRGLKNLYYFSGRSKGKINIFQPDGKKLIEISPFCYCRCILKQDKTWFCIIKYEIFLTNVRSFTLFPYMAKPQILITITSLDNNSKIIKDMRGRDLHILSREGEDLSIINTGRDETVLEWVITRKPQAICEDYDDIFDSDTVNDILEREAYIIVSNDSNINDQDEEHLNTPRTFS